MKGIYFALFWMMVGAFAVKAVEDMVIPRIEGGWDMVDNARHEYCKNRSRKWYRKVTFQIDRTYQRCMADEI